MKDLLAFLDASPSAFNAIKGFEAILSKNGFEKLKESEDYVLKGGKSYYVIRNLSSILAFKVPLDLKESSFKITASHSDCPALKLKPGSLIKENGYVKLNVEKYGGSIDYTWLDRPLSLAGRIIYQKEGRIAYKEYDLQRPFGIIPSLAIHMNHSVNNSFAPNAQIDLLPLVESGDDFDLLKFLSLDVNEDVIGYDLYLYPLIKAVTYLNEKYFSSFHIDDLECAYLSFKAFVESKDEEAINVFACFDNEEVGSLSYQGADSDFMASNLKRIAKALKIDYYKTKSRSFLVSCDNAHALHPNLPQKSDPINRPKMNEGIVIKYNANQSYTSDAYSIAVFTDILKKADVPYQLFTNRSDERGGSTLGNISNRHLSLPSVDIGLAQLAMHSSYETAGLKDAEYLYNGLKAFYETKIDIT